MISIVRGVVKASCVSAIGALLIASLGMMNSAKVWASPEWDEVLEGFGVSELNSEPLSVELNSRNDLTQRQLAHVTSDAIPGYLDILIVVDGNSNLHSGVVATDDGKRIVFTPEMLLRGVVIDKRDGRDIATLFTRGLNVQSGGNIDLEYLHNGITGSKGRFPMFVARYGNDWYLQTPQGQVFTQIFLKGKFFFRKAIGIDSVHVSR